MTAFVDLLGVRPLALNCSNSLMKAGEWSTCEIRVTDSNAPSIAEVQLYSTDQDVKIPAAVRTRPGQTRSRFAVYVDPYARQRTGEIKATIGETAITSSFSIAPATAPILKLPDKVNAIAGTEVSFTVSAFEPTGLSSSLSANPVPTGASFNRYTGQFSWTPNERQEGAYDITFTATSTAAVSSSKRLTVRVDSGAPVLTGLRNAVGLGAPADCAPGSLLSLTGRWLTTVQDAVSDPSGNGTELGGARVRVNAINVPIVYADPEQVSFICPDSVPGTVSNISVERGSARSNALQTVMADMAPGIYSLDGTGSGQGQVRFSGTSTFALLPNYQTPGRPAQSGDSITIRISGVMPADQDFDFRIGDLHVRPERIEPVAGMAGVYEAVMTLPNGIAEGDSVPVTLVVSSPRTGARGVPGFRRRVQSNAVSIAVERSGN